MSLERQESLLLAQQRRGYRRLRFTGVLEDEFLDHRVQRIRRRLLLIISTAVIFQLVYTALDLVLLPLNASLATLPMPAVGDVRCAVGLLLLSPPAHATATRLAGLCGGLCTQWRFGCGDYSPVLEPGVWPMPYDGLFLVLLFGYVLLGVSFRAVSLASWGVCGLFLWLGWVVTRWKRGIGLPGVVSVLRQPDRQCRRVPARAWPARCLA